MAHDGSDPIKILVGTSGHVESRLVLLDVHRMNHLKRQLGQSAPVGMSGRTSAPDKNALDQNPFLRISAPLLAMFSGTRVSNHHPSARALNFSVCAGACEREGQTWS